MSRDKQTVITDTENKSNNFEDKSNRQIEEMAKELLRAYAVNKLYSDQVAESLYEAGYRKASDLAEEIFAEIGEIFRRFDALIEQDNSDYGELMELILSDIVTSIAELKKKYIGKDINVTTNTEN